jgi:hypothetical protein
MNFLVYVVFFTCALMIRPNMNTASLISMAIVNVATLSVAYVTQRNHRRDEELERLRAELTEAKADAYISGCEQRIAARYEQQ